jgi:hypothetical protein
LTLYIQDIKLDGAIGTLLDDLYFFLNQLFRR